MGYTLKQLGSTELASMYKEYLKLTDQLTEDKISPLQALNLMEELKVVDAYGTAWMIDPHSGTFVTVDDRDIRTVDVDPMSFHPSTGERSKYIGDIPEYEYAEKISEDKFAASQVSLGPKRKVSYILGGVAAAVALFVGGFALASNSAPEPVPVVEEDPRPVVEGDGPTPERIQQVINQLGSNDITNFKYALPENSDQERIAWSFAVLGSVSENGYTLSESRTEENVSVLRVLDRSNQVVMAGDLEWTQDSGGRWILEESPLLSPVGDELPEVAAADPTGEVEEPETLVESPAAEPDHGDTGAPDPESPEEE